MSNKDQLIIGCMSWGSWGKKLTIKQQADLIQFCLENRMSTFDHADIYGDYTSESEFGEALKEVKVKREDVKIITKCGIQLINKNRSNKIKHYDYSAEHIIGSAENSLQNLQTEYIDTFLLHRPSPLLNIDVVVEAIDRLKSSGKILDFGLSNFSPYQIDIIHSRLEVSVNQVEFSLTRPNEIENGSFDHLQLNNIKVQCWGPMGSVYKLENEQTNRIKLVLRNLSSKYDIEESALLLSWISRLPYQITPVIGTTNKERILNAKRAVQIELELEDWFKLLQASTGHEVA